MSVVTRTNLATNPSAGTNATNYAAVAGTGGTAAVAWNSGAGYQNIPGYPRVTWSVATTAVSGGISYTATGLGANTQYATQIWVRCSKAQTVNLKADFRNSSNTIVNTVTGSNVALTANTWTQLTVVGTSGAAVTNAVFTAQAVTGGSNWAVNDWFDGEAILIEATGTVGTYFDGGFVNANSVMYAWTGTANASTSTAKTYTPVIALTAKTDAPCPRVEVTISDVTPTDNVINVWRTADGKRQAVRGARKWTVNGSNFVVDYEAPLGRSVAYDVEVTSGLNYGAGITQQSTTVTSATWWIQDPLVPSSAIAVDVSKQDSSKPYLTAAAVKSLEYAAGVNIIPVLGSTQPVALMGQRLAASGVDFSMFTNTATVTTQLRNLLQQTPLLLVRSNGVRNNGVPGLAYYAAAKPVEHPVTVGFGGTLTNWALSGDLVAAPTMNVLVPVWTYGNVAALWATYQQAQTALAAKTYLDVLKSPSGT